ncbi:FtsX-like permease family protein [Arthrobacter castelli]|uniref:FtsX-like permease family protein n=1 Tax=Arthrobacter castelli TaxID=271431 RepID=UPI000402C2A7|nr:FtsX-like permease family protein [Arthrobacter castelli]
MALLFLSTKRAGSRHGLLGLIFLAIACITAILAGTLGYTQLAATNALRQSIPAASGLEAFHRLHASQPDAAQDRQAQTKAFEQLFDEAGVDRATNIFNSIYTSPVGDVPSSGTVANIPAEAEFSLTWWPQAGQHVTVAEGELPQFLKTAGSGGNDGGRPGGGNDGGGSGGGPAPAAVTSETAEALGLQVGDILRLASEPRVRAEVAAVVDPDRQASVVLSAADRDYEDQRVHSLLVSGQAVHSGAGLSKTAWTIMPDPQRMRAAALPGLIDGLESLEDRAISTDVINVSGVVASGALTDDLRTALSATRAVQAVVPMVLTLLVLISFIAIFQLARLLAGTRSEETALLGARGLAPTQHLGIGLLESAAIVVAGTAVGYVLASTITPLITSVTAGTADWTTAVGETLAATWPVPILTAAAAVVILTGTAIAEGIRPAESLRQGASGRRTTAGWYGLVVLLLGAAALALWQFRRYGSPLSPGSGGTLVINPAAVAAPALTVAALAVVAVPALALLISAVRRAAAASRGLAFPLAASQVSRSIGAYALPIVLITLTIGSGTLAAAYTQTSRTAQSAAAHLANGSDVRIRLPSPTVISGPDDAMQLQQYNDVPGASELSPAITGQAKIGEADVELAAVQPEALGGLLHGAGKVTDAKGLTRALTGDDDGRAVPLPPGTARLRLQLNSSAEDVPGGPGQPPASGGDEQLRVSFSAWLESGHGHVVPVPLGTIVLHDSTRPQSHSFAANLPEGLDAESVRAIDYTSSNTSSGLEYTVSIDAMSAIDGAGTVRAVEMPDGVEFHPVRGVFPAGTGSPDGGGFVLAAFAPGSTVQGRLLPTPPGGAAEAAVPVVVTEEVLQQLDLSVGEKLTLLPPGTQIPARITAAVPVLPSVSGGLGAMIDITAYQSTALASAKDVPQIGELWFASSDPDRTAAKLQAMAGPEADITTAATDYADLFLAPAVHTLWIGTAGALVVSMIALAAGVHSLSRQRETQVHILGALGQSPKMQAFGRRWELLTVGLFAVAAGLATGWICAVLTVQGLAGTAVLEGPAGIPVPLGMAWPGWIAVVVIQLLVLVAGAWLYGAHVRRQFSNVNKSNNADARVRL